MFENMDLVGLVNMVDMMVNMDMVENLIMVDIIDMVNMHNTFGYLKLLGDTSGWRRLSW